MLLIGAQVVGAILARGLAVLYQGPENLDGWTTGPTPTAWQLSNGVLLASANAFLGRDLKLPAATGAEDASVIAPAEVEL